VAAPFGYPPFRYRLTWSDVDYARVVHYLRCVAWVDDAFHGHLYERGFHIREFVEQGFGLPYLASTCRYMRMLTLEDEVEIHLALAKLDAKGFTLQFRINKVGDAAVAAEGEMVRRCIHVAPGAPPKSTEMPPALRDSLKELASASGL
jgi:YbgC/YbaW family acyl-CoA thioester hydrolase